MPPAHEIGPFQLLHDQEKGKLTIHDKVDFVALARCAKDGITAKDAARSCSTQRTPRPLR